LLPNTARVRIHFAFFIFAFAHPSKELSRRAARLYRRGEIGYHIRVRHGAQSCLIWANFVDY
jgi:hypothetical protein